MTALLPVQIAQRTRKDLSQIWLSLNLDSFQFPNRFILIEVHCSPLSLQPISLKLCPSRLYGPIFRDLLIILYTRVVGGVSELWHFEKKTGLYSAEVNSFAELIKAFTIVLDWIIISKQVLIYNHTFWELSQIICLAQRMHLTTIHLKDIKWLKLATWLSFLPETVWNSRSLCCLHILSKRYRSGTFICQKWFLFC